MSQVTGGLINDGETAHFKISYESSMSPDDGRNVAQALMNVIEGDLALIKTWFAGVDFVFAYPINVELHNASGGAGWVTPPDIAGWIRFHPTVKVKAVGLPPPEQGIGYVRHLIVAEVVEMFMASKDNGWFENRTLLTSGDEGSKGEGLSRFLGHEFNLAMGIARWFPHHTLVRFWLTSGERPNYVDSAPDDNKPDIATGGTTCFIYYLHDQLGFGIPEIINAGSTNLAGVYQKLTGRTDAWTSFIGLVDQHYPRATTPDPDGDNVFPVPNLTWMDTEIRMVAGNSAQLSITLDRPTAVDVTVQLVADDPAGLKVPATVTIPADAQDTLVLIEAALLPGPPRTITVRGSYAGATVVAPVTVLPAPSGLTVQVTGAGGWPLERAILVINGPASAGVYPEHIEALTAADGTYTSPPLSPGIYTVEVTASGYVPVTDTVEVPEGVPSTRAYFTLTVLVPVTVSGIVTDQTHQPLAGVSIFLVEDSGTVQLPTTTDAAGSYNLTLDTGGYTRSYTLTARLDGHVPGRVNLASIPNGAALVENFALPAFGSVTGVITNADDTPATPLAGAQVTGGDDITATSDAGGKYALQQVVPGPLTLDVTAIGFEPATPTSVSVPSGATLTQDFALTEASATLTGTIVDAEDNSPIASASINVSGAIPTHSTANGSFTVSHIPAGSRSITIKARGYQTVQFPLDFVAHQSITLPYGLYPPDPPGPVR